MPTAYFLINARLHHEDEIIKKVKAALKGASVSSYAVQGTFGIYDIIVKISAANDDMLRKVVLEKLRKIENIESAITMMVNEEQE